MTTDQLARYRSSHRIHVQDGRCAVDDLRVFPTKGGRLRHDPGQILRLLDVEYGGEWPSKDERVHVAAVEVARDMVREGFIPDRLSFEWHGHAVDVDVAPDPEPRRERITPRSIDRASFGLPSEDDDDEEEWTNREGMPEFNGSFR